MYDTENQVLKQPGSEAANNGAFEREAGKYLE